MDEDTFLDQDNPTGGGTAVAEPTTAPMDEAAFDTAWGAALSGGTTAYGETPPPAQPDASAGVGRQAPSPAAAEGQPGTAAPAVPSGQPVDPATMQARLAELEEQARTWDSVRGNFQQSVQQAVQQARQQWEQEQLTPIQRERDRLATERQQAIQHFIQYRPDGSLRPPVEQQQVRAQVDAQAQQEQGEQRRQQEDAQRQQQARDLQAQQMQVGQAQQDAAKMIFLTTLDPWINDLAQQSKIPVAELKAYVDQAKIREQVQALPDSRLIGPMIVSQINNFAAFRSQQLLQQNQDRGDQKYRTEGIEGTGSASTAADRWAKASDEEFMAAWGSVVDGTYGRNQYTG